ncbi:protein no-on-transient A-like [Coccinella septempunctata]|uniref:protein no-on-transient A-like n=1 Tax=Coccinella septempunctata TaxID=41139 RepID=UPI001D05F26D|nr:protein no-on-transient A-like [Coccinella septempunctata]
MATQNPDTTGTNVESSTENGNPDQNPGGHQRTGGNFRRGGGGGAGKFGGKGRFQNQGQRPRNDGPQGGPKREFRDGNQRNFHRDGDHAMKTPQDKMMEKLNQISGSTLDLPPLDMTEKKFSGRNRLYVGNIGNEVSEDDLIEFFKPYGEVGEVFVNKEKNFGFVKFDFHSNAAKAKRELDGTPLKGRNLRLRFAPGGTAIKVKNLTSHVSNELLYHAFQIFGEIERATIIIDDRGKHTGEGIVEFVRKGSALAAIRECRENCFFLTSSLRPCIVEPYDVIEDNDGLPDKLIPKRNPEFQKQREVGPRFAQVSSFEHEYGMRWKQLHELFTQKEEALKKELEMEKEKLEAQMEYAKYEHETEMLREQLRVREMDKERQKREWEMKERQAEEQRQRTEEQMRRQEEQMQARMIHQEEELRRRQQENSLFMQAHQLDSMLDAQDSQFGSNLFSGNADNDIKPSMNNFERERFGADMGRNPGKTGSQSRGHWVNDSRRDDYPMKRRRF